MFIFIGKQRMYSLLSRNVKAYYLSFILMSSFLMILELVALKLKRLNLQLVKGANPTKTKNK